MFCSFSSLLVPKTNTGGVELLVLGVYLAGLLRAFGGKAAHAGVESGYLLVEFGDVYVLGIEFHAQLLQLAVLFLKLFGQVLDGFCELVALYRALAQLLAELVYQLPVLPHGGLDELDVLFDALGTVASLASLGEIYPVLCLVDFAEALLYLVHCAHHVVQFVLLLGDNLVQRVALLRHCGVREAAGLFLLAGRKGHDAHTN